MKKIDDARKRIEESLALSASKMIDENIIDALRNNVSVYNVDNYGPKTTIVDDKVEPLTYGYIREAQKKMATSYDYEHNGVSNKKFPVLYAFMNMPSISKHIEIKMDSPTASDPYRIQVNIDYNIPIGEEYEYKKGLYDFIMNFISGKSLNDHEIQIFEQITNDMFIKPKTLDDINDIINQI